MTEKKREVKSGEEKKALTNRVLSLSPTERQVLDQYIRYSRRFNQVFPSQATIARNIKRSRKTVQRCVDNLRKSGWLTTTILDWKKKEYFVSDEVYCARAELITILPNLFYLPVKMLMPSQSVFSANVPLLRYRDYRKRLKDEIKEASKRGRSLVSFSSRLRLSKNTVYEPTEFKIVDQYLSSAARELLSWMNGTVHAELILCVFDPAVVEEVLGYVSSFGHLIRKKWAYVINCLLNISRSRRIEIKWHLFYTLRDVVDPYVKNINCFAFKANLTPRREATAPHLGGNFLKREGGNRSLYVEKTLTRESLRRRAASYSAYC